MDLFHSLKERHIILSLTVGELYLLLKVSENVGAVTFLFSGIQMFALEYALFPPLDSLMAMS